MKLTARLYRQFDADPSLEVPGEAYGGWHPVEVDLAPEHTALVVMHAWDCGPPDAYPGWRRAVEYLPRAERILAEVFPRLLASVRMTCIPVFHVVGGPKDYYSQLPGFLRSAALSDPIPPTYYVTRDPTYDALKRLRSKEAFPGLHNQPDIDRSFASIDFASTARPLEGEAIASNAAQLTSLCRHHGINHLVYVGFAINWCLLMAPGGMIDMARVGCLCSTIEEAVTAVENRETARAEFEKKQALWRIALEFGFIFQLEAFLSALPHRTP